MTYPGEKHKEFFTEMKNTMFFQSGGLILMGDLPRLKTRRCFKVVKNTEIFQRGEKCRDFSKWWKIQRFFKVVLLWWATCPGGKQKEFSRWWEMWRFLKMVKNTKIFQSVEKYKDFSKWSCCNGRPAQMERFWKIQRFFQRGEKCRDFSKGWEMRRFLKNGFIGFIVMGHRPKWKMKRVLKEVWL